MQIILALRPQHKPAYQIEETSTVRQSYGLLSDIKFTLFIAFLLIQS